MSKIEGFLDDIGKGSDAHEMGEDPFDLFLREHHMRMNPFSDRIADARMFVNKGKESLDFDGLLKGKKTTPIEKLVKRTRYMSGKVAFDGLLGEGNPVPRRPTAKEPSKLLSAETTRYGSKRVALGDLLREKRLPPRHPQPERREPLPTKPKFERGLTLSQKLSLLFTSSASLLLIYISLPSLIYILTVEFSRLGLIKNTILLLAGIGAGIGVFPLLKAALLSERLMDAAFEGLYKRMEPVLREFAAMEVRLQDTQDMMHRVNYNVEKIGRRVEMGAVPMGYRRPSKVVTAPDMMSYFIKSIVLINITVAAFIFMLNFPWVYLPYISTALFFIWWLAITSEYDLWQHPGAWASGLFPILVVPTTTILMDILLPVEVMFGLLFIVLTIYVYGYHTWSNYVKTGMLPEVMNNATNGIKNNVNGIKNNVNGVINGANGTKKHEKKKNK